MLRISICDDNRDFISSFRKILSEHLENGTFLHPSLYEIGPCFDNGKAALEYLKNHIIDVLFLDIRMPDMNGFELAKDICRDYKDTLLVFVSAYDEYVYEVFDYSPFGYLRKSRISEDLPNIIDRLNERLTASKRIIRLSSLGEDMAIDVREILFFECKKNYYAAHAKGGSEFVKRGTISKLEEDFGEYDFFRTHSGYLVNLKYVERITEDKYLVIGSHMVPIALKRFPAFKKAFEAYKKYK